MTQNIVTRFAPSPTGYLHIGGARTALYNWLFARHHGGKMLLRVEDTDRTRSTQGAIDAILQGMTWLGLDWEGDAIYQFSRKERHVEVAQALLSSGKAYQCYASAEELEQMREEAKEKGLPIKYDGRWRDRDPSEAPDGIKPTVRLKVEQTGQTIIKDLVQGDVIFNNAELDDLILLRSDGTPTYMLAVVVDDHDMEVSHIIRGDDHLNNAARQAQIFKAMGWDIPTMAHIPLIHGADGAKLSKRHGALGVEAYAEMGYLPQAMTNYLARLGWSHGNQEYFSTDELIQYFSFDTVGKGAARLDLDKMNAVNAHHMRNADPEAIFADWIKFLKSQEQYKNWVDTALVKKETIIRALPFAAERAKTLVDLSDSLEYILKEAPFVFEGKALKQLNSDNLARLSRLSDLMQTQKPQTETDFQALIDQILEEDEIKLGKFGPAIRLALTGTTKAPGLTDIFTILGAELCQNNLLKIKEYGSNID